MGKVPHFDKKYIFNNYGTFASGEMQAKLALIYPSMGTHPIAGLIICKYLFYIVSLSKLIILVGFMECEMQKHRSPPIPPDRASLYLSGFISTI